MTDRDELVRRLRSWNCGWCADDQPVELEPDTWKRLERDLLEAASALSAQQPVATEEEVRVAREHLADDQHACRGCILARAVLRMAWRK